MSGYEDLSPEGAIERANRASARIRKASRWAGWLTLICGVFVVGFFAVVAAGVLSIHDAMWFWVAFTLVMLGIQATRRVRIRELVDPREPTTVVFAVAAILALAVADVLEGGPAAGWIAVLGLVAAAPMFVGAWRMLRR